uniref:Sucrose-phosphatase 1-like isoform X3 n=1 Tax=Rhizophora mucronata TaxID=61149 RepID=A0A2P2M9P7_RHIMU
MVGRIRSPGSINLALLETSHEGVLAALTSMLQEADDLELLGFTVKTNVVL